MKNVYILSIMSVITTGCQTHVDQRETQRSRIHQRNFTIWLENQTTVKGGNAFKKIEPCPAALGHGHNMMIADN